MPTFDTPQPILMTVSILAGDIHIATSDRTDTIVDVRPANPTSKSDLKVAEQTRIEYTDGRLVVKTPKHLGSWFGRTGTVEVTISAPAGSHLRGDTGMGDLRVDGRLGECHFKSGMGAILLDETGALSLVTGMGEVTAGQVNGEAHVTTGGGAVRIREITGTANIKNSHGDTWIGAVSSDLRVSAANGDIVLDRTDANVVAQTAHGTVRAESVSQGSVTLKTAHGNLEVGIRQGTAAWLDANTSAGRVLNYLNTSEQPTQTERTVEVRAHTYYGDIIVRRG